MLKRISSIVTVGIIIAAAAFAGNVQAAEGAFNAVCRSWDALLPSIDTTGPGVPIVVFNPLPWTRTDAVEVESPFPDENTSVKITGAMGKEYAAQTIGDRLFFTARDVPGMGYRVFWANRVSKPVAFNIKADSTKLENQYIRVSLDPKLGVLTSILDKRNNKNVLASGAKGLLIQLLQNQAASSGKVKGEAKWKSVLVSSEVVLMDSGPVKATIVYDHDYNGCRFVQQITIYDGVPRADVRFTVDMQGASSGRLLLPLGLAYGVTTLYVNMGKDNSSGWSVVDTSQLDFGISFVSDKARGLGSELNTLVYSFDASKSKNVASETCFSIYPHKGSWGSSNALMSAFEINEPLIAKIDKCHSGKLPSSMSYLSIDNQCVSISSIERLQDSSILIGLKEIAGKAGQAAITVGMPVKSIIEADAAGNPTGKNIELKNGKITVNIGAAGAGYYRLYPE